MQILNKLKQLNTKTLVGLSIIACIVIMFTINYLIVYTKYTNKNKEYNKLINEQYDNIYKHKFDSLNTIILNIKYNIKLDSIELDSLYKVKQTKSIIYEKEIKDFNVPSIVSDDSISRYISKKLHNK